MSATDSGDCGVPRSAPKTMSVARARDERQWLLARLEDTRRDLRRFAWKADECGWPEVGDQLVEVDTQLAMALDILDSIGATDG